MLVEDATEATLTGPASIWRQVGHGRWSKEGPAVAMGDVGNDVAHGGPCTGDEGPAPMGVMGDAGNGVAHGDPCTAEGAELQVVLGARELGFDDPEGDPFAYLDAEEF